tara:strand:+ start:306 stop:980 length:675 start_codon:yes stop_codon:yes gene_type:complete
MHQSIDRKKNILIYVLFLVILSTTSEKFIEKKKNYSSKINQINIKGLSNTETKKISNDLNYLFYKNILLIDKDEIQKVINKYNIIEEYSVKKIYPSTININIQPTNYVVRLSNNKHLIGSNGKLIEDKKNTIILPYMFGQFNSENFLKFQKNIIQSKFTLTKFKTLYFFPSNRWDILTHDNILIKLPTNNISESLDLAYKVLSSNDFKNKKFIDLRLNNYLIIK